ncbi:MAG: PLP-dependent aminotransferase family protein, partial [Oxalobacter sp.]|nr:PLP-dependent aminotransferase family protein [Oxalobacter sp.]
SYSSPQGLPEHRRTGSDWVARFGIKAPPQNIVITAGAHHALFIICNSLLAYGDRIATDFLTYPGIKTAAQRNGIRLESVHMDADGMLPEELDLLCRRQNIKAVYLSGRIQNPTNREMSTTRRLELREVISRHGLVIIENDSYGFLSHSRSKTLSALLPDNSIYISSLSKAFYAGLRIAYVAAPSHIVKKLTQGIADNMLTVSPFCAEIASECIKTGLADISIRNKKLALIKRRAIF